MEESHTMHCEQGDLSFEKSKRKLKTPAQLQALEKFYNEHKYPNESMKLQFAEQIGLSEKQVSGWFCHRRSKDKKLLQDEGFTNINQNPPNGAFHDDTSGLRQESCNSTKQVDRPFDGKVVESNRFHGQKKSAATPQQRGKPAYVECYGVADDRSSGSSTTSYEKLLKNSVDSCTMKSRYSCWDESYMLTNTKGLKKREQMDTTSSDLLGYVGSPAVYLVRLKLGAQYREDGPPLATVFDSLPPGAFDSPVGDSYSEPYYVGDSILPRSSGVHVAVREHKIYDKTRRERIASDLRPGGSNSNGKLERYSHHSDFTGYQLTSNVSNMEGNDPSKADTMDEEGEDFSEEAPPDYRSKNMRSNKYGKTVAFNSNMSNPSYPNGLKTNANNQSSYPLSDRKYTTPMSQKELFRAKVSKLSVTSKRNEYPDTENGVHPRGMLKVLKKKIHKHNRFLENCKSVWPQMVMTTDTQMDRKLHGKTFRSEMLG